MSFALLDPVLHLAWLGTGLALGVGGMVLRQRVLAWREARQYEWDPY
ncbi:hypothetical protein [Falsiroseomonas sp. CW058]